GSAPQDVHAVDEPAALDPAFGAGGLDDFCQGLAQAAEQFGLAVWFDLSLARARVGGMLHQAHPEWYEAPGAGAAALDPRLSPQARVSARLRLAAGQAPAGFLAFWQERLVALHAAGLRGVRLLEPQCLPAPAWRALIDGVH